MSDAKHTPGPWLINHERIGPAGDPVALLCDVNAEITGTVIDWPICCERGTNNALDDSVNKANARLIASAPALLEALEDLQLDLENNGQLYGTDYARLAVIADALALAKKEVSNASST